MNFIETHKAFLITALISATVVLALFSFSLTKKAESISESYYKMEPQTADELEKIERIKELEAREQANAETNEAYNEDKAFDEVMNNFKSLSNDHQNSSKTIETPSEASVEDLNDVQTAQSNLNASKNYAIKEKERHTFNKANDILAMHSSEKDKKSKLGNKSSSVSFSLVNRKKVKLPPPVYLCEVSGKIVVNITVNANGNVTDTYINSSSSSDNQCLIDAAKLYAEQAVFSPEVGKKKQIGSITYYFKGKN